METLATLLELVFLVSFIVAIVYGIKWFKNRNDKENDLFKKNKKRFWISIAVVVISFIHNWREYPHFDKWRMNRPLI